MFIVFISKRSTVLKIICYFQFPESEKGVGNQREMKDADAEFFVAKHLLHLFNAVNVPIIDKDNWTRRNQIKNNSE